MKVLGAFNTVVDTHMTIESQGHASDPADEFNGRWDFRIDEKNGTENNKQFGERVLRELGKAVVNMVDKAEDDVRYRTEIATISLPVSDVPNDVLI